MVAELLFGLFIEGRAALALFEVEKLLHLFVLLMWTKTVSLKQLFCWERVGLRSGMISWSRLKVVYEMYLMMGLDYLNLTVFDWTLLGGLSMILGRDNYYSQSSFIFLRFKCAVSLSIQLQNKYYHPITIFVRYTHPSKQRLLSFGNSIELICYVWLLIKMEWKKCKSSKLKSKHYKQGCSKTLNSIESHKFGQHPNNDRILTRDDYQIGHEFRTQNNLHPPFCALFKQNKRHQESNTKCSTFTSSLYTNHHDSKLSKELTKIGRQFEHQNDRIKTLLRQIQKESIHSKHTSSATVHGQRLSLSQKIRNQNLMLRTMCTLKPYR